MHNPAKPPRACAHPDLGGRGLAYYLQGPSKIAIYDSYNGKPVDVRIVDSTGVGPFPQPEPKTPRKNTFRKWFSRGGGWAWGKKTEWMHITDEFELITCFTGVKPC